MQFGPNTNYDGTLLTNYDLIFHAVGDPAIDASGNVTAATGLPKRIHLGSTGIVITNLQQQNYFVTNALPTPPYFNQGYLFRAPLDTGPTIYLTTQPGVLIPGKNYFVTLIISNGTGGTITFNSVTNALGYQPLQPTDTNGFIRLLQATNVTTAAVPTNFWSASASLWISNLISLGTLTTNRYAAGTLLTSSTNSAGLVTFAANSQTNGFTSIVASNPAVFINTNALPGLTNGFVRSDITNNAATVAQLISATNAIAAGSGISASTATNIMKTATNGYSSLVFTNVGQVVYTNMLVALTNALATTNFAKGITNGYSPLVFTNVGQVVYTNMLVALTNALATTNFAKSVTNNFTSLATTNAAQVLYTNALPGLTNGFVDKSITNNAATVDQLNQKADTNAPIIWDATLTNTTTIAGPLGVDASDSATNRIGGQLTILGQSVKEGSSDNTATPAHGAHAEGGTIGATTATGNDAHAEGTATTASGNGAHAEGNSTIASGLASHAEGGGTTASGSISHAAGQNANATNNNSYVWSDGTAAGSVTNKTFTVVAINGIKLSGGVITGNGAGLTNTTSTNFAGPALAIITNIASGVTTTSAGITNAYGTNLPPLLFTGQRLYIPTNFDAAGGSNFLFSLQTVLSNFLYATKLDETNSTAYGLTITNPTLQGNVSFGATGQATNIYSTTNAVKFVNCGISFVTNHVFEYDGRGSTVFTNRAWPALRIAFSAGTWLLQTNNFTLYSLVAATPFGTWTLAGGDSPVPTSYPTIIDDHNGKLDVGQISLTNILTMIGTNSVATSNSFNGTFIPVSSGKGTNTFLENPTLEFINAKWGTNSTGITGGFWNGILSGNSNQISAGFGTLASVICGGFQNGMPSDGFSNNYSAIVGGAFNQNGVNYGFVGGGIGNRIDTNAPYSSIVGGKSNTIASLTGTIANTAYGNTIIGGEFNAIINNSANDTNWDDSAILGGRSNRINGAFGTAAGRNIVIAHNAVFGWSDGTPVTSQTNSQFLVVGTNGLNILVGGIQLTNLNPGAATMALGVNARGQLTTNAVPTGSGSQTPIAQDVDYATFNLTNGGYFSFAGNSTNAGNLKIGGNSTNAGTFSVTGNQTNFGTLTIQPASLNPGSAAFSLGVTTTGSLTTNSVPGGSGGVQFSTNGFAGQSLILTTNGILMFTNVNAAVGFPTNLTLLLNDSDSIFLGSGAIDSRDIIYGLTNYYLPANFLYGTNAGVGGKTAATIDSELPGVLAPWGNSGTTNKWQIIQAGINDLAANASASVTYGHLDNAYKTAHASNCVVIAVTITSSTLLLGNQEIERQKLNALILDSPDWDYCIQLHVGLPPPPDDTVYNGGTHYAYNTNAGYIFAQQVKRGQGNRIPAVIASPPRPGMVNGSATAYTGAQSPGADSVFIGMGDVPILFLGKFGSELLSIYPSAGGKTVEFAYNPSGNVYNGASDALMRFDQNTNVTFPKTISITGSAKAGLGFATLTNAAVAPASITFPATTVPWTNTFGINITLFIDNNTVTGTAVSLNGQQIFSGLTSDLPLAMKPGDYFSETYTVGTPTARWTPR